MAFRSFCMFAALAVAALSGCGKGPGQGGGGMPPQVLRRVGIETVQTRSLSEVVEAQAALEPRQVGEVGIQTQGRVISVEGEEGATVRSGQVLARLSSTSLDSERASAAAAAAALVSRAGQARADLAQKKRDLERTGELVKSGVASKEELEQARTAADVAEATLQNVTRLSEAATHSEETLQARIADLVLRAPLSGHISRRSIEPGQVVHEGHLAFRIVQLRSLKAVGYVTESQVPHLEVGQTATIEIAAVGDSVEGTVTAVVNELDRRSRMAKVEVALDNPDGRYSAGMRAIVRITVRKLDEAIVIPTSAIISRESSDYIFVMEDNKALRRDIVIDFRDGLLCAVREGLSRDEQIIVSGLAGLRDGTPVEPASAQPGETSSDEATPGAEPAAP